MPCLVFKKNLTHTLSFLALIMLYELHLIAINDLLALVTDQVRVGIGYLPVDKDAAE
jgi:hypothetical protein